VIFISQSGITDSSRAADWDGWYREHLRLMASVPGVSSAQRFKTDTPGFSPSLAIYGFASADIFKDPYYLSVRGMGEWLSLIDRRYYKRNLFAGIDEPPHVRDDEIMHVADRQQPERPIEGVTFAWLECVGIDHSTPYRGLAVVASPPQGLPDTVAIYRPASPRVTASSQ